MSLFAPILLAVALAGDGESPFGFRGLEVYRATSESVGLQVADLDGDRLLDLIYADNADATIRLLYQKAVSTAVTSEGEAKSQATSEAKSQAKSAAGAAAAAGQPSRRAGRKRSVNEIRYDERFRVERFYTEKRVTALQAADLDSDGKPDLAYYGDPAELEVVYQRGEWGSRREKFPIKDGVDGLGALVARDLDGDGKSDLVLVGKGKTYLFYQRREGGLERPQVIYNSYPECSSVLVGDIDGDRRPDLCLLQPRADHPFMLRFQRERGFGPEIGVKSLPIHGAWLEGLDGSGRTDVLAVQGNTHRLRVLRWGKPKDPPQPALSEPRLYALRPDGDASQRRLHFGDVDGDGRVDLLVSTAETAEIDVYLQNSRGELSPPAASPTLAEVKGIATGDVDGDGTPDVITVSAREKALGVSRWLPEGRLSIPESFRLEAEPLLVAASPAVGKKCQIALVEKGVDGRFRLSLRSLEGKALAGRGETAFDAGAEANGLTLFDANGDGLLDAMVFVPYEDPRLYLEETVEAADAAGAVARFQEVSKGKDFGIGQISRLAPPAFSLARPPMPATAPTPAPAAPQPAPSTEAAAGSEAAASALLHRQAMLVAQKSYARALVLEAGGRLKVVEQFSGRGAAADIAGAAALNLDDDPEDEVLLFDRSQRAVDILDRSSQGTYQPVRSISIPAFEFGGFRVLDLNGDKKDDVALIGKNAIAVLYRGAQDGDLEEASGFDPDDDALRQGEDRGLPDVLAAGDLNADGSRDLIVSTDPLPLLAILSREQPAKEGTPKEGAAKVSPAEEGGAGEYRVALSFPIFEEKSYQRRKPGQGPREIVAADLTGDGKEDLVLLIHDRILVYPQE